MQGKMLCELLGKVKGCLRGVAGCDQGLRAMQGLGEIKGCVLRNFGGYVIGKVKDCILGEVLNRVKGCLQGVAVRLFGRHDQGEANGRLLVTVIGCVLYEVIHKVDGCLPATVAG